MIRINTRWSICHRKWFYKLICKDENFLYLNSKNVPQPKVSDIITDFLKEGKEHYVELKNNLSQFKDIFQYVYSNVYPQIYCSTKKRGFSLRSTFHIMFKIYEYKKNTEYLGKNPQNYENVCDETSFYE